MSGLAEEPVVEHAATDPNVYLPQSPAAASVGTMPGSGMSASSRKGCRVTPFSELTPHGFRRGTPPPAEGQPALYWRWPVNVALTPNNTTPKGEP
jgi:hypothetical protein